tara:strand:- start:1723 stop:3333 length:1611 start_codon:yes stop_codon:yes gene_type:complete
MADLNFNVGANVGGAQKAIDGFTGGAMSKLQGVTGMFTKMNAGITKTGVASKGAFAIMKRAIIATGIGALLIAITSLISYFKNTQQGADKLARATAGVGAAIAVITDRMSAVGEVLVNAFSNPKQAIKDLWEALKKNIVNRLTGLIDQFKAFGKILKGVFTFDWDTIKEGAAESGTAITQIVTGMDTEQQKKFADGFRNITNEIVEETKAAMRLKGVLQELRDAELDMITVKAKMRQQVAKARLDAMDETKSEETRLIALGKVAKMEEEHTKDLIALQKQKIATMQAEIDLGNSMHEEFVELENEKAALIDLQTKSFMTQKRIQGEVEALTIQLTAKQNKRNKLMAEAGKIFDEEELLRFINMEDKKLEAAVNRRKQDLKDKKKNDKEKEKLDAAKQKTQDDLIKRGFTLAKRIGGENSKIQKGLAVAETIFNTQKAVMKAHAEVPVPFNIPAAILMGLQGAAAVQKILSTNPETASSTSAPQVGTGGGAPAPMMTSGAFTLGQGLEPEPVKAFVVTDEMTDSQTQLADIRRRATI